MTEIIDTSFDFTTDTPRFWHNYWLNNNGMGAGGNDPDCASPTLLKYHKLLWSRKLPNGKKMELAAGYGANYLTWENFRFGSDSITASFRYERCRSLIEKVKLSLDDYKSFFENYTRKSYTIGGEIIFPKRHGGINQTRGCNRIISDRWDLTLECIRLYYLGENSPLYETLHKDKEFFDLFIDFKGYVDFFFLQDFVSPDYNKVKFIIGDGSFSKIPLPQTVDEYMLWMSEQVKLVSQRNKRIFDFVSREK